MYKLNYTYILYISFDVPQPGVYAEDKNEALTCNTKKDGARLNERTAGILISSMYAQ